MERGLWLQSEVVTRILVTHVFGYVKGSIAKEVYQDLTGFCFTAGRLLQLLGFRTPGSMEDNRFDIGGHP
jgi:hypothetical protein